MNDNLNKGGEAGASGAVSRSYDKHGKRMYTASPTRDTTKPVRSMPAGRKAGSPEAHKEGTKRTKTF